VTEEPIDPYHEPGDVFLHQWRAVERDTGRHSQYLYRFALRCVNTWQPMPLISEMT
jgi:hypothetical protein